MGTMSSSTVASPAKQKRMRGWAVERFGDPSRDDSLISLEELPMPECDRHDVLIRMHGAEVGDWDAIVASGEWSVDRPFPIVLGLMLVPFDRVARAPASLDLTHARCADHRARRVLVLRTHAPGRLGRSALRDASQLPPDEGEA